LVNSPSKHIKTSNLQPEKVMPSIATLNERCGGKRLLRLLALLLALAVSTPVLLAQEWDHLNGRDKVHDPTGAWLVQTSIGLPSPTGIGSYLLIVFHHGGTVTVHVQGESGFDPVAVKEPNSIFNVISMPQGGTWQKTGWNTFVAAALTIEYRNVTVPQPSSPLFRFDISQYAGKLTGSGDTMELSGHVTFFDPNKGTRVNSDPARTPGTEIVSFNANGTRIPLPVFPDTLQQLPIPSTPAPPQ
jgi:hypothetical protein